MELRIKKHTMTVVCAAALLMSLVSATITFLVAGDAVSDKALGKRVSDFALDDQFERSVSAKFANKYTIVMIGDRKGLETMRLWEEKIMKEFGTKVQIVRIAYFKGMPFFVPRGLARNEIKEKHPKSSVLCDWDGNASAQFAYTDGGCRVYLCDPNATIRAASSGECSSERWQPFMESLRTIFQ
jgi:hypothetical protein